MIGPIIFTFYLSFTEFNGFTKPIWIGLKNYSDLFHSDVFFTSIINNLKWILLFTVISIAVGLFLALITNIEIKGIKIIRTLFYIPVILSGVVVSMIWSWIYTPNGGLLNSLLEFLKLEILTKSWLTDTTLVTYALIIAASWPSIAFVMIIYNAGLINIDPTLLEAASVDGASKIKQVFYIIIPQLKPSTGIAVVTSIISSLHLFDYIFILTKGGPYYSSSVLAYLTYVESFKNYNMGYGAAIAIILFLIAAIFIFTNLRNFITES